MSMTTLTGAAAMFTQYWPSGLGMTSATFVLLLVLFFMNACGVQLYGRMEWIFKWLKIALLLGLCILMVLIKAGGEYTNHLGAISSIALLKRAAVGSGQVDSSEWLPVSVRVVG